MNNDVQAELSCEVELLLKQTGLPRFVGAILDVCFDLFFDFALECASEDLHVFFLCRLDAWQMMIIEAGLANPDDAPAFGQFA